MRTQGYRFYSGFRKNLLKSGLALFSLAVLTVTSSASTALANGLGSSTASPPLVSVSFVPGFGGIVQGDSVTAYISVASDFNSPSELTTVLTAQLDGKAISLLHPSQDLWIAPFGAFGLIQSHTFTVSTYVEDTAQAKALDDSISKLNEQAETLRDQIAHENDPGKKSLLTAQLMQVQNQLQSLRAQLQDLTRLVGRDSFQFNVGPNNAQGSTFPHISGVNPGFGPTTGGTKVTLTGTNFTPDAQVSLSGQNVGPVTFVSSSELTFTLPPLSVGPKDVQVLEGSGASQQNAYLQGGFVVTPASATTYAPVAFVVNPAAPAGKGSTVTLNGSGSYAPTGRTLSYAWHFVSVPTGSTNVDTNFAGTAQTTFSPDSVGTYVIQLTVSDGLSTSDPSLAVLTVYTPGAIQLAPADPINFATRIGQPKTIPVTITNTSTLESVQIASAGITDAAFPITVNLGTGLPITLTPGASVTVQLKYDPTTITDPATTHFQVTGTGLLANSPLSVAVPVNTVSFEAFPIRLEQVFNTFPNYTNTLADGGFIDLFAVYDTEVDSTINIVNQSDKPITLNNPPTLTPINGDALVTISVDTAAFPLTIQGNSSAPLKLIETPAARENISHTEAFISYGFSWKFGLDNGAGIDQPLNLVVNSHRLSDIGTQNFPNSLELNWGIIPQTASPTPILWPTPNNAPVGFFPSYSGCCAAFWTPTYQWLHQVTAFTITGPSASQFTAFFHTGSFPETAVPSQFDFGNADVAPPLDYQQFAQIDYYFTPIANQTGTYNADLQIQMAGLSTPISIPLTATVVVPPAKTLKVP